MKTTKLLLAALIAITTSCAPNAKKINDKNIKGKTAAAMPNDGQDSQESTSDHQAYINFSALATDNSKHELSEYIQTGKYTIIDFWASWCGPCRAAIPHMRNIYNNYNDRLNIIAVSLDQEEDAWRDAVAQEKMEWTQLWAADNMDDISNKYQIQAIPFIILINDEGKIISASHSPQDIDNILEQSLKLN